MMSPFDSKNRVATALDRLALRVLLFFLSVGYFFALWHSGAPSLRAAAKECGVNERTLRKWLAEDEFAEQYNQRKREALQLAWGALQNRIGDAGRLVSQLMNDGDAPHQVRLSAARTVLEYGLKSCEQLDILPRLEALEQAERDRKGRKRPTTWR